MMVAMKSLSEKVMSSITIALLKDTGFYTEVNDHMSENMNWGKGKGCDFVQNACYSK